MNQRDFDTIATHLKKSAGLTVAPDKAWWLYPRLTSVVRQFSLDDLSALAEGIRKADNLDMLHAVTDAALDTDTSFMRDKRLFTTIETSLLSQLRTKNAATKKLRVWCAGCSAGQEAYALAIVLQKQAADFAGWEIEILGTDISATMIARAQSGDYSQFDVQRGLPVRDLLDYFTQTGDRWQIAPELKLRASFKTANLLEDFSALGQFDMIFCRNVLSAFDTATKKDVLTRLRQAASSQAFLILGETESLLGLTTEWASLPTNSVYQAKA
jgi:chemotaxis protein methyltransferase CheR